MFAQVISLGVSFLLNMIVPKFITELDFANWQAFVLYISFVGVLHFGLLDGIILKYSKYNYDTLDKGRLKSQFFVLTLMLTISSVLSFAIGFLFFEGFYRTVMILLAFGILSKNIFTFQSYLFQITNRIGKYAIIVIAQRLAYGVVVVLLLLFKVNNYIWYCIADLIGDTIGFIIGFIFNFDLFRHKSLKIKEAFKEAGDNIRFGIMLMLSNWTSVLIIGIAKIFVQIEWNQITFGKVAFSFSVASLFLAFVTAASIALFPSLKRMKEEELPDFYVNLRSKLSPFLYCCLILYFPGVIILRLWLPVYSQSLTYLSFILPIIIFSSRIGLLTNNYFKAYRKEKTMMFINIGTAVTGAGIFAITAFVFKNIKMTLLSVVLVLMMQSFASELFISKYINRKGFLSSWIGEIIIVAIFVLSASSLFSLRTGVAIYFGALSLYFIINKILRNRGAL